MAGELSIGSLRREYTLAGLRRMDLETDPMVQFAKWFQHAVAALLPEPNAMTLATADAQGRPSARIVLLKAAEARGFIFFTHYESRKGRELAANPNAALVFHWPELERQICIAGTVSKIPHEESVDYYNQRPRGSRISAWVSRQSEPVSDRETLENLSAEFGLKHPGDDVPLPPWWGGYCLAPARIEFWQGRPDRLHDRFEYLRQPGNAWRIGRLSP